MKLLPKLLLLALPVLAAACGGGGSSDKTCASDAYTLDKTCTQNPTHNLPEGIWSGAASSDQTIAAQTLVLENGQYFTTFTKNGSFYWMIEGVVTATSGSFTDTASVGLLPGNIRAGQTTGTFTSKGQLSASSSLYISTDTAPTTWAGTYNTVYDTPIAISDVARTWTSASGTTPVSTLTINADGTASGTQTVLVSSTNSTTGITTTTSNICTFSGSFKPRSTGKHVLDGTLTFAAAANSSCYLDGKSMPVEATSISGQLTVIGVTAQRDQTFFMSGQ
jgi:hypothetical protein